MSDFWEGATKGLGLGARIGVRGYEQRKREQRKEREEKRRREIEEARAEVQRNTALLALARAQLSYTEIKAPVTGRIMELLVEQGDSVTADKSNVVSIYDPGKMDEKIVVGDDEAYDTTRLLATREGVFVGMSGGAALEACACGTPVIVTPRNDIPGLEEYQAGYRIDSRQELESALVTLLEKDDLRQKMGGNARRLISDRYALDRVTDRLEEVFLKIVKPRQPVK